MTTIEYIPFGIIESMDLKKRVKLFVNKAKKDIIVVTDGKLSPEEEANLIEETMKHITKSFPGIEIASLDPDEFKGEGEQFISLLKKKFVELVTGKRYGITIVGPAKIIKEIKKSPDKLSLLMK